MKRSCLNYKKAALNRPVTHQQRCVVAEELISTESIIPEERLDV
jgi:hypothetical protein